MKEELSKPKKRVYSPPSMESFIIEMEQGIASGSAAVVPPNSSAEVLEEWDLGTDREQNVNW